MFTKVNTEDENQQAKTSDAELSRLTDEWNKRAKGTIVTLCVFAVVAVLAVSFIESYGQAIAGGATGMCIYNAINLVGYYSRLRKLRRIGNSR